MNNYIEAPDKIKKALELHQLWLNGDPLGEKFVWSKYGRGNISVCDGIDFSNVDLRGANLFDAYFRKSCLKGADLRDADLRYVDLSYAILDGTDLNGTDLEGADFSCADLGGADLRGALLEDTIFENTKNLDKTIHDEDVFFDMQCPETSSYHAYKVACSYVENRNAPYEYFIVELEIPADAKRSSAIGKKCRASKAKVIDITLPSGETVDINHVYSIFDRNFVYRKGKIVKAPYFNENRWRECAPGIHHFVNREDAISFLWSSTTNICCANYTYNPNIQSTGADNGE